MTAGFGAGAQPAAYSDKVLECQEAEDCLIPMGITSENVAAENNITRETQDKFAADSFRKAAAAQKAGKFVSEIIPVTVKIIDPKTEEEKTIVVDSDDGIREGVTAESLAKLKPAFSKTGTTHAGNASQVSDGAAAVLLARRSVAKKLGLPIVGKFVTASVVGVPPRIMGSVPSFVVKLEVFSLTSMLNSVLDRLSPSLRSFPRLASARTTSTSTKSTRPSPARLSSPYSISAFRSRR